MAATDYKVTIDTKEFERSKRRIIAGFGEMDKTAKNAGSSLDRMVEKVGAAATAYFSIQQAQQFLNKVIEIRGQFQKLDIAFTTMLQGNREASSKLMNELTEFASVTPFGLMDAASGAKQLLAYGFDVKNVVKDMEMLGNVASGVSAPLNDIVYLYGTLKASGRVATMDIRQFAGRGIPIYRELAEVLGVAEGEINDLVSAGKVGFNDIEKAFKRMTGEGGTFYNLMREQSKSLPGQISNLEDSIDMMFNEIGAASQDFISKGIEGVAWLVENYEKVGKTLLELVGAYGAYKVALVSVKALMSGMTAAELAHYAAIVAKEKAQKLLNATMLKNPYVLAAAGVAALAYRIYKLATAQSDVEELQKGLNKSFAQSQVEAAKEITELDRLKGALQGCKKDTDQYKRIKEEIVNKFGKYDDTLKAETLSVQTLTDKYDALTKKVKESTNERMYNNWLAANQENYNKKEAEYLDEIYEALEKNTQSPEKASQLYQQLLGAIYKGYNPADRNAGYTELYKALHNAGVNDEANSLAVMFRGNEKIKKQAQQRFGITGSGSTSQTSGEATVTAEKTNKKFWEKKKKEAEVELEALATYELNTQKANDIRAKIAKADAKIALYDTKSKSTPGTAKANLSADYAREMAKQVADAQLEIRQASIDAMDEGFAKENAQLEFNYHKQLQEITNMESEMVEKLRDYEQKKWEQANPKAKEQGKAFDRSSITAENLTNEQKSIVNTMYSQANAEYLKDSTELHKELLKEWQTYEEQRIAITEKYNKISADVIAAGGTQENLQEVNRKNDKELEALDEQFASRSADFEAWANTLTDMTVSTLIAQITEVNNLLQNSGAKGVDLAVLRQKQTMLEKEMNARRANKKANDDIGVNKRSLEEWKELEEVIQQGIDTFEELGEAVGGVAGEIISTAGSFATSTLSMINGIVTLVEWSTNGMKTTAEAGATAIKTVEKASVILAIISAVLEIAKKIASLFNQDAKHKENIENLQTEIDALSWILNNREIVYMWGQLGKAVDSVNQIYAENLVLAMRVATANEDHAKLADLMYKGLEKGSKAYNQTVKEITKSYADLTYAATTMTQLDQWNDLQSQLENIAEQQLLVAEQQAEAEQIKDDKDREEQLRELEHTQEELRAKAAEIKRDVIEGILGDSAKGIAERLSDAFWEAAEEGKNAMEAVKKETDDVMRDIAKNMLTAKLLEKPIEDAVSKFGEKVIKPDGSFAGVDAVEEALPQLAADFESAGAAYVAVMEALPEDVKEFLFGDGAKRQSSSRGIATASQESVDENNARLTTIQAHTASIAGNVEEMVKELHEQRLISLRCNQLVDDIRENTIAMIQHLQGIETNTGTTNSKLDKISSTLTDIQLKGVKMK